MSSRDDDEEGEEIESIENLFRLDLDEHCKVNVYDGKMSWESNVVDNNVDDDGFGDVVVDVQKEVDDKLKLIEEFCEAHPIPQRTYTKSSIKPMKRQKRRKGEKFGWTEQEEPEIKLKQIKNIRIKKKSCKKNIIAEEKRQTKIKSQKFECVEQEEPEINKKSSEKNIADKKHPETKKSVVTIKPANKVFIKSNKNKNLNNLEGDVLERYKKKIEMCEGLDPFELRNQQSECDKIEDAPPMDGYDVSYYLTEKTSYYTGKQFKAHKSLEAYKFFEAGRVHNVVAKLLPEKTIILAEVSNKL